MSGRHRKDRPTTVLTAVVVAIALGTAILLGVIIDGMITKPSRQPHHPSPTVSATLTPTPLLSPVPGHELTFTPEPEDGDG